MRPSQPDDPSVPLDHITICLCTCRRAGRLAGLLSDLARQESGGAFTYSLSVVDNDPAASASEVIAAFARKGTVPVQASWEPEPNIARARNRSLAGASGNLVAFIDDDETPAPDWLRRLHTALLRDGTSAVLGPVRPRYASPPPAWVVRGRFWERDELPTGSRLPWTRCRTGNALVRKPALDSLQPAFDERLTTGARMWISSAGSPHAGTASRGARRPSFTREYRCTAAPAATFCAALCCGAATASGSPRLRFAPPPRPRPRSPSTRYSCRRPCFADSRPSCAWPSESVTTPADCWPRQA